jgi:hypothetical protein
VVDLGTSCVRAANEIYLVALPEALPTSIAKVIREYKLPALSHPGTFNSPLSDIPFHSLPCLPPARYRYLNISSIGLGSDPRPGVTHEPRVIHSPSNTNMSDHESRGSEGASSGGEEQTPTPQDDIVNPSQRPESLQPEAEQEFALLFEEIKGGIPKGGVKSEHMATAEKMKAHFLSIHANVHATKKRKEDPDTVVLDTIIVGNPGTGGPFVS